MKSEGYNYFREESSDEILVSIACFGSSSGQLHISAFTIPSDLERNSFSTFWVVTDSSSTRYSKLEHLQTFPGVAGICSGSRLRFCNSTIEKDWNWVVLLFPRYIDPEGRGPIVIYGQNDCLFEELLSTQNNCDLELVKVIRSHVIDLNSFRLKAQSLAAASL